MSDVNFTVTYFKGGHDPLSNFFKASVNVYGRWFPLTEHVYQWRKVTVCGEPATANTILATCLPPTTKELVR